MKMCRVVVSDDVYHDLEADSYEVTESGAVVFFRGEAGVQAFAHGQWARIILLRDDDATLVVE